MRVLILSAGQDTGGQGARIARAFRKLEPSWDVRAMHTTDIYIRYKGDLPYEKRLAQKLYDAADVVHHKNGTPLYDVHDNGQLKPAVVHHHGSRLRMNPEDIFAEAEAVGAVHIVSTVDLLDDAPGATWIPSPFDIDEMRSRYPRRRVNDKVVRIGHAPTNRKAKNTAAILEAIKRLARHYPIELDLIEQVAWSQCLKRKSLCDIFIDQLTLGYGNNGIEAMILGVPVVSGWELPADRQRFIDTVGIDPPFCEASASDLEDKLAQLVMSAELRDEWSERGYAFAQTFHSERSVVERLKPVYREAVIHRAQLNEAAARELEGEPS